MANWNRTPPKSMSVEEIKKRVDAGLKRWQAKGWMPKPGGKRILTVADGPTLDKAGRKRVIQATELAVVSLCNSNQLDFCHAIALITATRRLAGLKSTFTAHICEGVVEAAAAITGEPIKVLDQLAKRWLVAHMQPTTRLISLPTRSKH